MRTFIQNSLLTLLLCCVFALSSFSSYAQVPINNNKMLKVNPKLKTNQMMIKQVDPKYKLREKKAKPATKKALMRLRNVAVMKDWTFSVGYTKAMDKSIQQLTGLKLPRNWTTIAKKQNEFARQMNTLELKMAKTNRVDLSYIKLANVCAASKSKFNYRDIGKVSPVKNQSNCGSCWAFAAMGAYESNYLLRNNRTVDVSEQDIVSCAGAGSCAGGWHDNVFNYMMTNGVASESGIPYRATNGSCRTNVSKPYRAVNWGFVTVKDDVPSVSELKNALCKHGSLAVCVKVTNAFRAYTGGVFNENDNGWINHVVTLVGWDDEKGAWLIKNSWGTWWGDNGYMWIKYGANSIGYAAAWVKAPKVSKQYVINKEMLTLMQKYKKVKVKSFQTPTLNNSLKLKRTNNAILKQNN